MTQHLIFYIDQYINNLFFSRSEPFFDRLECEQVLFDLRSNLLNNSSVSYKISISMPLEEYEQLELSSHKLKIKFINFDQLNEVQNDRNVRSRSPSPSDNSLSTNISENENNDLLLDSYVEDSHIHDSGYELLSNKYKHQVPKDTQEQEEHEEQEADLVSLYDNADYNDEFSKNFNETYVAYKYKKGYIMKNKKKNRRFLRENCIIDHFYTLNENFFYITKKTINDNCIPFFDLVNLKKKTPQIKQALLEI